MLATQQDRLPCILVVDDNADVRDDYRRILLEDDGSDDEFEHLIADFFGDAPRPSRARNSCFTVRFAEDGAAAVETVRDCMVSLEPIALAFVDMSMPPGIDGIETIRQLWRHDPQVQVVICTAHLENDLARVHDALGITDRFVILKKPFDIDEVRQLACALTTKWLRERQLEEYCCQLRQELRERAFAHDDALDQLKDVERFVLDTEVWRLAGHLSCSSAERIYSLLEKCRQEISSPETAAELSEVIAHFDQLKAFAAVAQREMCEWDVNDSLETALNVLWHGRARRHALRLEPNQLPRIRCCPQELTQAVMSILLIALDAAEAKGDVVIRTEYTNRDIIITVQLDVCKANAERLRALLGETGIDLKPRITMVNDAIAKLGGDIAFRDAVGRAVIIAVSIPVGQHS